MSYPDLYVTQNALEHIIETGCLISVSPYKTGDYKEKFVHESKVKELESKLEIAREAMQYVDVYLSGSYLNMVGSNSILHNGIKEALERIK